MGDRATEERLFSGYSGRLFVILTGGFFVLSMARRLLPPLLPEIVDSLGITPFGAGLVITVFTAVRATAQYPGGRYSDALSRKTVLVASFGLAMVGFGTLAVTADYATLVLGVAVVGGASGLFFPANHALLSDLFAAKRARAFGINLSASDVTGIVAAGLAIAVVEYATWQSAFLLVVVPVGVVLGLFVRTSRERLVLAAPPLDLLDTVRRLLGRNRFRSILAAYALRSFGGSGVGNFLPLFLIAAHGFSFEFASGAYALTFVVGVVAKPFSGVLGDRFSRPGIAITALLVTVCGIGLLVLGPSWPFVVGGVALYAFGQKSFIAPMQAYLMDSFPDASMGGDLGATRLIYISIGSVGPSAIGYVAEAVNFRAAFGCAAVAFVLATGFIVWIERSA